MVKILVWVRKKDWMTDEEFRAYWTGPHAALAQRTYPRLVRYFINPVTRVPRGEVAPFNGVAEMVWGSREDFDADVRSPEARALVDDLAIFAAASGTVFVEEHAIVG